MKTEYMLYNQEKADLVTVAGNTFKRVDDSVSWFLDQLVSQGQKIVRIAKARIALQKIETVLKSCRPSEIKIEQEWKRTICMTPVHGL